MCVFAKMYWIFKTVIFFSSHVVVVATLVKKNKWKKYSGIRMFEFTCFTYTIDNNSLETILFLWSLWTQEAEVEEEGVCCR